MWNNIKFNLQQIETTSERAVLINMPNSSDYKGYAFWHPAKLVREMDKGNGYWLTFSFTDDWDFTLIKNNRKISVKVEDIIKAFEPQQFGDAESYVKVSEPAKINDDVEVDESLKR